jgi:hypothetical protein
VTTDYRDTHDIDLDPLALYLHLDLGFEPFDKVLARRKA